MQETETEPALLRTKPACEYSGFMRSRLFEYLREGKLKAYKAGKQTLVDRRSLDALIASLPAWQPRVSENAAI